MTKTHWKKVFNKEYLGSHDVFNKEYLGSHDLDDGKDLVAVIDHVEVREIKDPQGTAEKRNIAIFQGNVKPMVLNVTNCKIIKKFAASNYIEEWSNIPVSIYSKEVKAFGEVVDALRIREGQPRIEKPKLTPDHPKWADAVGYLKKPGTKISGILKGWEVSEENQQKLQEEAI
jgi:hypothetical protein